MSRRRRASRRNRRRPPVQYVPMRDLEVELDRPWLASTDDVEEYLAILREQMLEAIQQGKRLQL